MNSNNFSILAIIGISSLVLFGIYIIFNPLILNSSATLSDVPSSSNQHLQKIYCGSPQFYNILPKLNLEQQRSSISLAISSEIFQKIISGSNYTVVTVAPNYSFNPKTCSNVMINGVTVGFKLSNGSSLGIYEDGKISKVTGAKIMNIIHG